MPELVCLVGWLAIGSLETVQHSPFCYIWASSKTYRMILSVFNYQQKSLLHGSSVNNVLHAKPGLSGSLDCTGILCKHLCIFTLLVGLLFPLGSSVCWNSCFMTFSYSEGVELSLCQQYVLWKGAKTELRFWNLVMQVRSAFVLAHSLLTDLSGDDTPEHIGLLGRIVRMDEKLVGRKLLPALVTTASENLQRPYRAPCTRFRNTQESAQEPDLEPYVVGDGTFSASDSDSDPAFKTPQKAGWRSQWHDYEDGDFPRGTSSGRKFWKKGKEKARHKDRNSTPYLSPYGQDSLKKHSRSRWQESVSPANDEDSCTKHSHRRKRDRKNSEVTGLEEGEVRPGKRAKKLQERLSQNRENLQEAREDSRMKWKQKQASEDGDQTTKVKRHNLHKSWSGSEIMEMTSDRNHSRFRRTPSRKEHWRHDAFEDL